MNRLEFMDALEKRLALLNDDDRADALRYYEELFDEAGPIEEQKIIDDLGSPEDIARQILVDNGVSPDGSPEFMIDDAVKPGSYTNATEDDRTAGGQPYRSNANTVLIIIIIVLTFPIWIGVVASAFGVAVSFIAAFAGLLFGLAVAGVTLSLVGAVGIFSVASLGIAMLGVGLFLIAMDLLVVYPLTKLIINLIVRFIKWAASMISRLFNGRQAVRG